MPVISTTSNLTWEKLKSWFSHPRNTFITTLILSWSYQDCWNLSWTNLLVPMDPLLLHSSHEHLAKPSVAIQTILLPCSPHLWNDLEDTALLRAPALFSALIVLLISHLSIYPVYVPSSFLLLSSALMVASCTRCYSTLISLQYMPAWLCPSGNHLGRKCLLND